MLNRAGHHVVEARDGVEALSTMAGATFDVVLLDDIMPGLTGVEALAASRRLRRAERPLVMVISALATRSDIRDYHVNGADDFLAKPFAPEELVDRVQMLLDERTVVRPTA